MALEPLNPDRLSWHPDPQELSFGSTAELEPLALPPGQDQAWATLEHSLGLDGPGTGIYVVMPSGMGGLDLVERVLERVKYQGRPGNDLVYVQDLDLPHRPVLLSLPPGQGERFRQSLLDLMAWLFHRVPLLLDTPDLAALRARMYRERDEVRDRAYDELEKRFRRFGLLVEEPREGDGPPTVGIRGGKKGDWKGAAELRADLRQGRNLPGFSSAELSQALADAEEELARIDARLHGLEVEGNFEVSRKERESVAAGVSARFQEVETAFPAARTWLRQLQALTGDRYWYFQEPDPEGVPSTTAWGRVLTMSTPWHMGAEEDPNRFMNLFTANLVHKASNSRRSTVIVDRAPLYASLVGGVTSEGGQERMPDWRDLHVGNLVRAQGGILVLPMVALLNHNGAWKALKRSLRASRLLIRNPESSHQGAYQPLQPEPIPLDLKVILVGDPATFAWVHDTDAEFRSLFRVRVELEGSLGLEEGVVLRFARHLASELHREGLPSADADAVTALLAWAFRNSERPRALSARFARLVEICREATVPGRTMLTRSDIEGAIEARVRRQDLVERRSLETLRDGSVRVDVDGRVTGQVNGLAVFKYGPHVFARPTRITATVGTGRGGLVNIERESRLSGRLHDKGVQILAGFLRHRYGRVRPLALTASLCFEQSYGRVDGDSASLAEACALLSALAGVPLRQDLAITGSMDQFGQVQPIGGVNEKIEGFYAHCQQMGLSGTQGVIVPVANLAELQLRPEVIEACRGGLFSLWPARTLEDCLELLTGLPCGDPDSKGRYPAGTFQAEVVRSLSQLLKAGQVPRQARPEKAD